MEPGQTLELPRWRDREVLLSRLTGNRVEKDPTKNQYISISSQYRPESFDVPLILRQTMFYQASWAELRPPAEPLPALCRSEQSFGGWTAPC